MHQHQMILSFANLMNTDSVNGVTEILHIFCQQGAKTQVAGDQSAVNITKTNYTVSQN